MSLPGREMRVKSWRELISKLHSRKIIQLRPNEGKHLRSPYVFRGVDVAAWGLETSLQRLPKLPTTRQEVVERGLLRSFRKYANSGEFDQKSEWYILAVGQHNGLPTRCLDWTASPLVAAHFACGDEKYKDKDGAIWCVDATVLRSVNESSNWQVAVDSLRGKAWVWDTLLLEQMFQNLDALDSSSADGDIMLLWEPPSLDMRIASQSGLLSIMNNGTSSHTTFLEQHLKNNPDLLIRIIIDKAMKSELRDMLDQNNVSERTLFPGLPGLCGWLKRYYGTAW